MFRTVLDAVIAELNTGSCLRDIANHWDCRCTVPGPGMRRAGQILVRRYQESGLAEAELIPYPADDRTEFLDGHRNPLEWRPTAASLGVLRPSAAAGVICRYADELLSLVCNSTSTPPEGVTAEVVVRGGPLAEAEVQPGEMAGRLLFTDQPPGSVEAAARKAGAVGVISDCVSPPWLVQYPPVREPEDAPDLVMWTIFSGRRDDRPLFGFNLSARQGRRLRQLLARSAEPVALHARVEAELVEGASDYVHAVLPGTDLAHEEIWVLAHLSEPGARDNASGCCLSVELARALAKLTASGALPPLRRTIRFMHATEVSGFLPYIDANRERLPQVVAGACLDSVGQDLVNGGGFLVLYQSPEANASFVDALMETLLGAVSAEPAARFSSDNYATFPWRMAPFWGNDAFVSDGFFDIPTPQLSTWPDRYYHSSQDTPDRMSANTLGRVGAAAGTFLYLLATAGAPEARWLGVLAADDWKRRICRAVAEGVTAGLSVPDAGGAAGRLLSSVRHLGLQGYDAVLQAQRFAEGNAGTGSALRALAEDVRAFAEREANLGARLLAPETETPAPGAPAAVADGDLVPRRMRWHAPGADAFTPAGRERLAALAESAGTDLGRIWPWINGRRPAREIAERLQHSGPVAPETIVAYLRLMADEAMVALGLPCATAGRAPAGLPAGDVRHEPPAG